MEIKMKNKLQLVILLVVVVTMVITILHYMGVHFKIPHKKRKYDSYEAEPESFTENTMCKPSTVSNPDVIGGWTYAGCYQDSSNRMFPNMVPGNQTPDSCIAYAKAQGAKAAGMQWYNGGPPAGSQCWYTTSAWTPANGTCQTNASSCSVNNPGGWTNVVYTPPQK